MDITLKIELSVPQLTHVGDLLMANLNSISTALDQLSSTLDQELTEIADALANVNAGPSQAEVDAVAQRVLDLKDRIANIIP